MSGDNDKPQALVKTDGAKSVSWYRETITNHLTPGTMNAYKQWTGLDGDELILHLREIRDRAWPFGEYPCVGSWLFLEDGIAAQATYPQLMRKLHRQDGLIVDVGCCFGHDLRRIAVDGDISTERMLATDLHPELWELGFELFRDHDRMKAQFIGGDIFDSNLELWRLSEPVDMFVLCQFLHLFSLNSQKAILKKFCELSHPGTAIIGYQMGRQPASQTMTKWGEQMFHDISSFKSMFAKVQSETGTLWDVDLSFRPSDTATAQELAEWLKPGMGLFDFTAIRTK